MDAKQIWERFVALRTLVKNEQNASVSRIDEFEDEWEFLYDAVTDESDIDCMSLTDEQFLEVCHFHSDNLTSLVNW